MAIRKIMTVGDDSLRKKAKPVEKIDDRIKMLLDDMSETMYASDGIGLAANQIGILKRIVVADIGDGLIELINPEIVSASGEAYESEGCLSVPNRRGIVKRPREMTVRAYNRDGEYLEYEAEGLLARVFSHEIDHLNGILFIDKAEKLVND
ncbi:MAG TPA: peptide deformylase [Clostridia bacterium]|nr:peptide deformylase [Clostridia bacterium]